MKSLILIISLMLLVAAPVHAEQSSGPRGDTRAEDREDGRKEKPVIIIKGKGGKVTKVKKPDKKK